MKKTYIAPMTNEVKIGVCRMVCASDGTLDKNQTIDGETVQFGSRRGKTIWDDADE